jgi:hypothetical protein
VAAREAKFEAIQFAINRLKEDKVDMDVLETKLFEFEKVIEDLSSKQNEEL